jgi:hypothetical protein
MRLAGREANLYRQAIGIHDGMNFGRQPATRAAHVLLIIAVLQGPCVVDMNR